MAIYCGQDADQEQSKLTRETGGRQSSKQAFGADESCLRQDSSASPISIFLSSSQLCFCKVADVFSFFFLAKLCIRVDPHFWLFARFASFPFLYPGITNSFTAFKLCLHSTTKQIISLTPGEQGKESCCSKSSNGSGGGKIERKTGGISCHAAALAEGRVEKLRADSQASDFWPCFPNLCHGRNAASLGDSDRELARAKGHFLQANHSFFSDFGVIILTPPALPYEKMTFLPFPFKKKKRLRLACIKTKTKRRRAPTGRRRAVQICTFRRYKSASCASSRTHRHTHRHTRQSFLSESHKTTGLATRPPPPPPPSLCRSHAQLLADD